MQIDGRLIGCDLVNKIGLLSQPNPIGVEHHVPDITRLGGCQDSQNLRVDGRFAAANLNDFRLAFSFQKTIKNRLYLCQAQVISGTRVSKAGRTRKVAASGDFNKTDTGVLLVLRTQTAIKGAALFHGSGKSARCSSLFVILERV